MREVGPWSEQTSSTGKKYYYNHETEVSQWEKPDAWKEWERKNAEEKSSRSNGNGEEVGTCEMSGKKMENRICLNKFRNSFTMKSGIWSAALAVARFRKELEGFGKRF